MVFQYSVLSFSIFERKALFAGSSTMLTAKSSTATGSERSLSWKKR